MPPGEGDVSSSRAVPESQMCFSGADVAHAAVVAGRKHALGLQPHCKQMSTFELFLPARSGWIWHPAAWRGLIPGPSLRQGSPSPGFPSHSHLAIIYQQFVTLLVTILKLCKPQKALHEVSVFITYRPLALNAFCSC